MSLAFYPILGKPLVVWGGIITFIFLLATLITGNPKLRFKLKLDVKVHMALAAVTFALAVFHMILGLTAF